MMLQSSQERELGIHLTADESEGASEMKTKTIDTTLPQQKNTKKQKVKYISSMHKS